jgi:predicted RNase H-like nuclease (RuvC/YqgF family)
LIVSIEKSNDTPDRIS